MGRDIPTSGDSLSPANPSDIIFPMPLGHLGRFSLRLKIPDAAKAIEVATFGRLHLGPGGSETACGAGA